MTTVVPRMHFAMQSMAAAGAVRADLMSLLSEYLHHLTAYIPEIQVYTNLVAAEVTSWPHDDHFPSSSSLTLRVLMAKVHALQQWYLQYCEAMCGSLSCMQYGAWMQLLLSTGLSSFCGDAVFWCLEVVFIVHLFLHNTSVSESCAVATQSAGKALQPLGCYCISPACDN